MDTEANLSSLGKQELERSVVVAWLVISWLWAGVPLITTHGDTFARLRNGVPRGTEPSRPTRRTPPAKLRRSSGSSTEVCSLPSYSTLS